MTVDDIDYPRTVAWFSAGAASAVATKLALAEHTAGEFVIAYCDPGSEHPDNIRFISDCEKWFDHDILILRSEKYVDTWDVFEKNKYLTGIQGAKCSVELKKRLRQQFQRYDDLQIFGFTNNETTRADRFRKNNFEVNLVTPLIDHNLSKANCLTLVESAGIALPAMYLLGYHNANCIGCVNGGMGYWNKIRIDFPVVFERMAVMERRLGHSLLKDKDGVIFLDELDPKRGYYPKEIERECGLFCDDVSEFMSSELRYVQESLWPDMGMPGEGSPSC